MSFWSTQRIIATPSVVTNFDKEKVKEAAYTLTVGGEAFITSNPETKLEKVQELDITEGFCYIPPGQFAYLITDEEVNIPHDCLAFISMKFTTKAAGLVNVSGFHVDPGYKGKLIFAVYNAGGRDIPIRKGMGIFLIWFSDLDQADDKPKKEAKGYTTIPPMILENSQNAETLKNLSDKVSKLEVIASQSSFRSIILLALIVPFNFFILKLLTDKYNIKDIEEIPSEFIFLSLGILFILLFHIQFSLLILKTISRMKLLLKYMISFIERNIHNKEDN